MHKKKPKLYDMEYVVKRKEAHMAARNKSKEDKDM
jgi:hypothetical protein